MKKHSNRFLHFLLTAVIFFMFFRIALYDGLVVRQYEIRTSLVPDTYTFVLLTDLHATLYGEGQRTLLHTINKYTPDAVFLAGDIADDKRTFDNTALFLETTCAEFPCYYVTGNHERWLDYTDDIKELMRSYSVTVLDETTGPLVFGENIRIFGLDDPLFYENTAEYLSLLSSFETAEDTLDLLLAHRPEFYEEYVRAGMDLTLCGHAHGGQVRIPFLLNGLYAPNQGYFPNYAGGIYKSSDQRAMIVSRGLMKNEIPRIFNPPELCVIHVLPEK